ncbi:MAG: hypothetical protein J5897_00695, partial [Candidatus Methanomethylophilus sp.]|nr:hypothetical protein [Methanomethylophilus sp.]
MLTGTITNISTKETQTINVDSNGYSQLLEEGEYYCAFNTTSGSGTAGDVRYFTFHFVVTDKPYTPSVNYMNFKEYITQTISDCKMKYYGLTYHSAGKGNITVAFADYDSALCYAREVEEAYVEYVDGVYRYIGSLSVSQKKLYED